MLRPCPGDKTEVIKRVSALPIICAVTSDSCPPVRRFGASVVAPRSALLATSLLWAHVERVGLWALGARRGARVDGLVEKVLFWRRGPSGAGATTGRGPGGTSRRG